jgi:hypothetical protein
MSTVTSSLPLFAASSNGGRSPSSGFPGCLRRLSYSFSHKQLTTTEPQQSSNSPTQQTTISLQSFTDSIGWLRSKSKLLYGWRFTASQFILVPSALKLSTGDFSFFFFNWALAAIVLMWHPLWREDRFVSYGYACLSSTVRVAYSMLLKILYFAL